MRPPALSKFLRAVIPAPAHEPIRKALKRLTSGPQWLRVVMDRECDRFVSTLKTPELSCLEISANISRWSRLQWKSYQSTHYPDYDVCAQPLAESAWDVVIAEQVLEHVVAPESALRNMHAMLRPGGCAIVTTPFLIKFHPDPVDYYRWTEDGIRLALARAGFSRTQTGSWGNRQCLIANMSNDLHWAVYRPWRHSLKNNPRFPVSVWAFAWK